MDIIRFYTKDPFLTQNFKKAITYIKPFNFDLSQLDKRDFSNFIQIAFEPMFIDFLADLKVSNIYVHRELRPVFDACKRFVQSESNFASDYYCYGRIGFTRIHLIQKHFFDENWILFLMPNVTYGKVGTSGLTKYVSMRL